MKTKTEKNIVNEEIMNELNGIQWSKESEGTAAEKTEVKDLEVNKEAEKVKDVVAETAGENKEVENKEKDVESKADAEQATGKKRDVLKFGNKDWVAQIPEAEKFNEKTVFCWNPGTDNKIGYFAKYGKKEGMIWINMYKKDSFTLMSREWAARLSDCEVIEQDGKMLSDKYFKDEKGYHVKKEEEKKEEVAAAETAVATAKAPETNVTETAKVSEATVEQKEENVNKEMPLAE